MKPLHAKHALLVEPFNQSVSASPVISRILLRAVNAISNTISAYQVKKAKRSVYREVSDYPAYLLEDIGMTPDEVMQIRRKRERQCMTKIHESVRR
ncbi:hypothetical protein LRP49_07045 [Enterovibrio sp. ZSDZ35]|uniref:DUF1127 domain-containing protein n=1 Tax=Enterovibrio qingdaonensis TaxID=2899818 RepID=A0ABT5QIZ9_9GAMM|nr:hypothetical protein [Enterovibrio sp. ZSDZ35]MDD1780957.1 hypothetical protein [Enterovibrio sp. ZSDZ35]